MILYLSRYLLPVTGPPIEDGALLVSGGRIVAVGTRKALLAEASPTEIVDFGDAVLLPPLVNAHTHLELTHFPTWAAEAGLTGEAGSFVDWILRVIRVKRGLKLERYTPSLEEGIRLSLAAGTGAVGDILSCFPARSAYGKTPLKGRSFLETLGRDPARCREVLRSIGLLLDEKHAGQLELGLSPHSPYTLSAEYLEEVLEFARRRKVPTTLHFAESPDETAFLNDSRGPLAEVLYPFVGWQTMVPPAQRCSPAAYVEKRGGLAPWNLLVHGVQVDGRGAALLARSEAPVVLCPRSNARLGVGRAPVELYRDAGVPLALGTDSLASCDSLSIWDEMAFALGWFEGQLSPAELLQMATLGGSKILGLDGEMGCLQPGVGANFQVLTPPSLPSPKDLLGFLCSPGRTAEVSALYLDGRERLQKD